jgi:hypothetical protein
MTKRKLALACAFTAVLVATVATTASAGTPPAKPLVLDDSQLAAKTTTVGGATVLPTTRTIPHWFGQTTDPENGVTYGYNMVGADPNSCSRAACATTVDADIIPIVVNIAGLTFDGTQVAGATLDSPIFATNDYGFTTAATAAGSFPNLPELVRGPGGPLSQADAGQQLQLVDATMRAQFAKTGASSTYHLLLQPNVLPPVTIDVPRNQGTLIASGRGVVGAEVDVGWWSSRIKSLETKADPTHLAIFLTNQVYLYDDNEPTHCCAVGYHGTNPVGNGGSSGSGNGKQPVQTFLWASYIQPGFFSRGNGGTEWAVQDIHSLSHELTEWADDPFLTNPVEPWFAQTAPQYGCTDLLETGDPVFGIGFAMGTNTFEQGPNPDGSRSADGFYHPEDEAFLPWFMRSVPNTVSEPTQSPSANGGRYTLLGDLNPFAAFGRPATGC